MARGVIGTAGTIGAEHSPLKHPFRQAWTAGTLPPKRHSQSEAELAVAVAAADRALGAFGAMRDGG